MARAPPLSEHPRAPLPPQPGAARTLRDIVAPPAGPVTPRGHPLFGSPCSSPQSPSSTHRAPAGLAERAAKRWRRLATTPPRSPRRGRCLLSRRSAPPDPATGQPRLAPPPSLSPPFQTPHRPPLHFRRGRSSGRRRAPIVCVQSSERPQRRLFGPTDASHTSISGDTSDLVTLVCMVPHTPHTQRANGRTTPTPRASER